MNTRRLIVAGAGIILLLAGTPSCRSTGSGTSSVDHRDGRQATSLLGQALFTNPTSDSSKQQLVEALDALRAAPTSVDAIIWYGRRLGNVGYFREALNVFSWGLDQYPENSRLLRFRGHRYITLRDFEKAQEDLELAWKFGEHQPDMMEPDTVEKVNRNQLRVGPRSSDHGNIVYHLGLAHYLQGNFAEAVEWFGKRRELALSNDDSVVSSAHWEYLSLIRLGETDKAIELLATIRPEMSVVENREYYSLLGLYKGEVAMESFLEPDNSAQWQVGQLFTWPHVSGIATNYGIAAYLDFVKGEHDRAVGMYREIVSHSGAWPSFGFIAAEAELARLPR